MSSASAFSFPDFNFSSAAFRFPLSKFQHFSVPLSAFRISAFRPILSAMNRNHTYVSTFLGAVLMLGGFARAQEETAEPLELTRLREQFQTRVDQEMIPWRDKYKKELQKLEDRLVQERRLKEALAVKTERDYGAGLSSKPPGQASAPSLPTPDSTAEARKSLTGTVWLVYAVEDKKREALLDVYHFVDSNNVFVMSAKRPFPWSAKSTSEVAIQFLAGDIKMTVDYPKASAICSYAGKEGVVILAGRPDH
ncbi:MAG: hypothetical protein CFE26_02310 [Verrucomicrobiales bacterium VVV1]|nr:MAG: hypothetical protein CFE26_02310 [Verrucomicrobiales bacterium VVV1]